MAVIEFRTLGALDIRRTEGPRLDSLLAQPKRVALLTYLCLATPRGMHRRDTLLGLFWPDADQVHARASLRNALHVLRHALGGAALQTRGDEVVSLDANQIWCDALAFEDRLAAHQFDDALDLYRGDLLPGFFVDAVPAFHQWLEGERTRLRICAARAAHLAAERREAGGDLTEAVSFARRAVELSDNDERVVRRLIEFLARSGDRTGALHAYENFAQHLAAEFDAKPSAETRALLERLRSIDSETGNVMAATTDIPIAVRRVNMLAGDLRLSHARTSPARIGRTIAAALTIGVMSLAVWRAWPGLLARELRPRLTDRALITNTGRVSHSAISPNGKTLAYVTAECKPSGCTYALDAKDVDASASRRITDGIGELPPHGLEWSPDGSRILVTGKINDQVGTFIVSALGGLPRRLGSNRFAFWAGGDSLLTASGPHGDTLWIQVCGLDGVPRDSIRIEGIKTRSPADGIGRILPIPNSRWIAISVTRGIRAQWISIDRGGHVGDTLGIRPMGPSRIAGDALWLGFPTSESSLRPVVRIPLDPRSGHFRARQDTMYVGNWTAFDVTADGSTFVFDEDASEFTGWGLQIGDVVRGIFPEKRRLLTATSDLIFEVSPDGKRILVGRAAGPRPDGGRRWDILPFDGGPMMPLAAIPAAHTAALWLDSVTIPVVAETPKGIELALLDVNTGARRDGYVIADSTMNEGTSLGPGGWVWVPWGVNVLRLHRTGESDAHTLSFPSMDTDVESIAASRNGKTLLIVSRSKARSDSIRVSLVSLPDGTATTIKSLIGGASFAVWLADGSIMLAVWRVPDSGLTLYRLGKSGQTLWTATIPRPVWSISVSADLKLVALTVREYHGDASITRVIRG